MTVTVNDTWPYWCLACRVALHLLRSVRAGMCCCCRSDHAPDVRIDVAVPTAADVTLAVVA